MRNLTLVNYRTIYVCVFVLTFSFVTVFCSVVIYIHKSQLQCVNLLSDMKN